MIQSDSIMINFARRIAEYNAVVKEYQEGPSIFKDEVEKKKLDIEREKLIVILNKNMPFFMSEEIVASTIDKKEPVTSVPFILSSIKEQLKGEKKCCLII